MSQQSDKKLALITTQLVFSIFSFSLLSLLIETAIGLEIPYLSDLSTYLSFYLVAPLFIVTNNFVLSVVIGLMLSGTLILFLSRKLRT